MKQARERGVWCLPRVRARSECAEVSRQRGLGGKRRERRVRELGLVASMCYARTATWLRWRRQSRRVYTARADARLGQTRAAGTNERMCLVSSPKKKDTPQEKVLAQNGPFAVESRVLFYSWRAIVPMVLLQPLVALPLIGRESGRIRQDQDGVQGVNASEAAGCSEFELNRL